ncbi:MAG: hypothetical protein RMM08_08730 [Armatimonadota bacterium]|nr:hypothetical protein [bacterium]MDW8321435.1 hypothetical protein [Armatimonadota bacterium]
MRRLLEKQPDLSPVREGGTIRLSLWQRAHERTFVQQVLLLLFCLAIAASAQQQSSTPLRGWQKHWEFVLPTDTLSASLVDLSGEGQVRLVTLHADSAKEDVLHLRVWKREGESWRQEWQTALEPGELRGMATGYFVKGSKSAQVLTARNLVMAEGQQYSKRTRKEEVNWFACACVREGEDVPVAAYPGGVWRGVLNLSSGEEWLRFERVRMDSLLSLPQQFDNAQWVSLVTPLAFRDMEMEAWAQQGYDRLFAQLGKRLHPEQPLLVSRSMGEGKQSLALVTPPTPAAPIQVIWQSEPVEGAIKEARLVSTPSLRSGLLVLVGNTTGCRVQFWQSQHQGTEL